MENLAGSIQVEAKAVEEVLLFLWPGVLTFRGLMIDSALPQVHIKQEVP